MSDWITWIIQGAVGIGLTIIAFFWKKDQSALDQRLCKVEDRLDKHDQKFESLPYVFVTRDDFIRAIGSVNGAQKETNEKLDKIYDLIIRNAKEKN